MATVQRKATVKKTTAKRQTAKKTTPTQEQKTPLGDYIREGFGYGIGFNFAQILFTAVGLGIFIVGFILWKREQKKPKETRSRGMTITGIVLMGLGCVVGFTFGGMILLGAIGEEM
jgi:hypothetical protein